MPTGGWATACVLAGWDRDASRQRNPLYVSVAGASAGAMQFGSYTDEGSHEATWVHARGGGLIVSAQQSESNGRQETAVLAATNSYDDRLPSMSIAAYDTTFCHASVAGAPEQRVQECEALEIPLVPRLP